MIGPKTKSWVIGVILKTHRSSCRGRLGLPRNLQCRTAMAKGMRDTSLSTLIQYHKHKNLFVCDPACLSAVTD